MHFLKKLIQIIFLALIILSGCDFYPNVPDQLVDGTSYDLAAILERTVSAEFHPNLPSSKTYFQGNGVIGHSHHYYDSQSKELLAIGLNPEKDTTGISLFTYSEKGQLTEKSVHSLRNQAFPLEKFEYHYDKSDKLKQITKNGENFEKYEYNEKGQVEKVILGGNLQLAEIYIFEYDSLGRVKRQLYKSQIEGDSPLRDWYYGYNSDGLLVSKSIPISNTEMGMMFEYRYDAQKRLIEEIEYYPEYGFSLWLRNTIHYK
jgi:hypothetical protein